MEPPRYAQYFATDPLNKWEAIKQSLKKFHVEQFKEKG